MTHRPYEAIYDRAVRDPEFRANLQAHFGDANVIAVLRWLNDPQGAPPGAEMAATQTREELVHQVYSRSTDSAERELASTQLSAMDDQTRQVRTRMDEAIRLVVDVESPTVAGSEVMEIPTTSRQNGWWLGLIGLGAFLVGVAATSLIAGVTQVSSGSIPVPSDRPTPPVVRALQVFDGTPSGLPTGALPSTLLSSTAVEMSRIADSVIYAVRSVDGDACLVAIKPDSELATTCVADEAFPERGLRLGWSQIVNAEIVDLQVKWMRDGMLDVGGISRHE